MNEYTIILLVLASLVSTSAGVYGVVKLIQNNTSSPLNTVSRRGDIELNNFIEPSIPELAHLGGDLSNHHFVTFERIPSSVTSSQVSNRTNIPTSDIWVNPYSPDGDLLNEYWFNINSCLENENIINTDNIVSIILFYIIYLFVIIIIIRKL